MKKYLLSSLLIALLNSNLYAQAKEIVELNKQVLELKQIIKETNATFLREIFDEKYVKNASYFKVTDLDLEDKTKKFENSNVLINSIKADENNKDVFDIANKALVFNRNYLVLFDVRKNVLFEKYDSSIVEEALKKINSLPALEKELKLYASKERLVAYLKNYLENTCSLKKILSTYKEGDQTSAMKLKYTALEKDVRFKDYPYLVEVIKKIKNNKNDYTNDLLAPCITGSKSSTEGLSEKKLDSKEKKITNVPEKLEKKDLQKKQPKQ